MSDHFHFMCMTLVRFRLFRKNLGTLREFFGQMAHRCLPPPPPPGKKLSVRLWLVRNKYSTFLFSVTLILNNNFNPSFSSFIPSHVVSLLDMEGNCHSLNRINCRISGAHHPAHIHSIDITTKTQIPSH